MKRIISVIIAVVMTILYIPVFADAQTVSNTVWGYVSSTDGDIEIASKTKVPNIYIDEQNDYPGVARAAGDLLSDIEAVTGVTANIVNDAENARLADEYGIVMGTSHCEMLLRNNMGELLDFQERWISEHPDAKLYMFKDGSLGEYVAYDYTDVDAEGNPVDNKQFVEDYWRERVRANKDYESNFTIGMRGVHDGEWNPVSADTNEEKIALLEEIIAKQREILSQEIGKPAEEIPQTFIPYKEILPLYNAGLEVPDDKKPSFYELQLYAVKSANNIIHTFIGADKAALYKAQGRGAVCDDDRIYAGIDWDSVPDGNSTAKITITRYIGENAVQAKTIDVIVNNDVKDLPDKTYAEANGYVSMEAEHYTRSTSKSSGESSLTDGVVTGSEPKLITNASDGVGGKQYSCSWRKCRI